MKARLAPEAEQDADDAIAWYDLKSAALGDEFLRCVNKCIQSIERYPEMFPRVYRKMRRALVETFPYQVLYEIDPEENRRVCDLSLRAKPEGLEEASDGITRPCRPTSGAHRFRLIVG